MITKFWDLVLGLNREKNEERYNEYEKREKERLTNFLSIIEKEHPDENCPRRKYALLSFYGEPAYSIDKNGKIVMDTCTCNTEK